MRLLFPLSLSVFCSMFLYVGMLPLYPLTGAVVYSTPSSSKSRLEVYTLGALLHAWRVQISVVYNDASFFSVCLETLLSAPLREHATSNGCPVVLNLCTDVKNIYIYIYIQWNVYYDITHKISIMLFYWELISYRLWTLTQRFCSVCGRLRYGWPCHRSGQVSASHSGGRCLIPGQVVWGLWWTKWNWDGFLQVVQFPHGRET
jgi:hypothetical protein